MVAGAMATADGTGPIDLASLRAEYTRAGLTEADLAPDPFAMFDRWMHEAVDADLLRAERDGRGDRRPGLPALRRGWCCSRASTSAGFVFFTNTGSRKGHELAGNPRCALLFPWHPLERQVRVDGVAAPLDHGAVEEYFARRPRALPARRLGLAPVPGGRAVATS